MRGNPSVSTTISRFTDNFVATPRARFLPARKAARQQRLFDATLENFTPREREVMEMVVAVRHNREMAAYFEISPRTVEVHTSRIMQTRGVGSVAQRLRLSVQGSAVRT